MWLISFILPIIRLYLIGVKVLIDQLLHKSFTLPVLPRHDGKVAIVTGGARGMGYETSRHLASLGAHVVVAGNEEEEGLAAVKMIQGQTGHDKVEFMYLDLASLESVRRFVQRFKAKGLPLHILINNGRTHLFCPTEGQMVQKGLRLTSGSLGSATEAGLAGRWMQIDSQWCYDAWAGVMLVPERRTVDGFEMHFGLNYLGHFLLTNLLLDLLRESGRSGKCSRIVTVSSATHHGGRLNLNDLQSRSCYCSHGAYSQSKLALVLFTYHLQNQLWTRGDPVSVNAVDPGMVDTDLYQNLCGPAQLAKKPVARLLFRNPTEGASTAIYTAGASELEGLGGLYLYNGQKRESSALSYNRQLQEDLWTKSCDLVNLRKA